MVFLSGKPLLYLMKQEAKNEMEDELLSEYNFAQMKGGIKGKYVDQYLAGTNLVLLDADVAQAFPNEAAVNAALRLLMQVAQQSKPIMQQIE